MQRCSGLREQPVARILRTGPSSPTVAQWRKSLGPPSPTQGSPCDPSPLPRCQVPRVFRGVPPPLADCRPL